MIICLVRHGESEANEKNILSGYYEDYPLTPKGVRQSEEAGLMLRDIKFNIVYTSKLIRAISTAYLIENNIGYKFPNWIKTENLNERNYGILGGHKMDFLKSIFGEEKLRSWIFSLNSVPPKGESNFQTFKRVKHFYEKELKNKKNENIIVVSHFTITLFLIALIEGLDLNEALEKLYIKNATPIIYEIEEK